MTTATPSDIPSGEDTGDTTSVTFSSRICVKQLPKYVDEKRLREHFQAKGDITDVKVLRKK